MKQCGGKQSQTNHEGGHEKCRGLHLAILELICRIAERQLNGRRRRILTK